MNRFCNLHYKDTKNQQLFAERLSAAVLLDVMVEKAEETAKKQTRPLSLLEKKAQTMAARNKSDMKQDADSYRRDTYDKYFAEFKKILQNQPPSVNRVRNPRESVYQI